MSRNKKNTLKTFIGAALAAASVLLWWMAGQSRFQGAAFWLIVAIVTAFVIEVIVLSVLKGKNIIKRAFKIFLIVAVNISVFSSAVILGFAPAVILQPHTDEASYETLKGVPCAEEMTFEGTNGKTNGWFYNVAGEDAPVILYFYGNYETASTRLLSLAKNYDISAFADCNFAVFDYPAYGNSEGRCTDESILDFALDVYDELIKRTDNIIVLGYSVGTGPACYLASKREVQALILYAPYADSIDLYNNVIDIFHGPLELLVAFDVDSNEYVKNVTAPTLILASAEDELIPYESSMELIDLFGGMCTFMKAQGITHNQFLSSAFVKEETAKFINEVTAK